MIYVAGDMDAICVYLFRFKKVSLGRADDLCHFHNKVFLLVLFLFLQWLFVSPAPLPALRFL